MVKYTLHLHKLCFGQRTLYKKAFCTFHMHMENTTFLREKKLYCQEFSYFIRNAKFFLKMTRQFPTDYLIGLFIPTFPVSTFILGPSLFVRNNTLIQFQGGIILYFTYLLYFLLNSAHWIKRQ